MYYVDTFESLKYMICHHQWFIYLEKLELSLKTRVIPAREIGMSLNSKPSTWWLLLGANNKLEEC